MCNAQVVAVQKQIIDMLNVKCNMVYRRLALHK